MVDEDWRRAQKVSKLKKRLSAEFTKGAEYVPVKIVSTKADLSERMQFTSKLQFIELGPIHRRG